jgi:hypothetical protein
VQYVGGRRWGWGGVVAVIDVENRAIGRNSTRPSVTGFDARQRVLVSVNTAYLVKDLKVISEFFVKSRQQIFI